jgi:hypothetical protein
MLTGPRYILVEESAKRQKEWEALPAWQKGLVGPPALSTLKIGEAAKIMVQCCEDRCQMGS